MLSLAGFFLTKSGAFSRRACVTERTKNVEACIELCWVGLICTGAVVSIQFDCCATAVGEKSIKRGQKEFLPEQISLGARKHEESQYGVQLIQSRADRPRDLVWSSNGRKGFEITAVHDDEVKISIGFWLNLHPGKVCLWGSRPNCNNKCSFRLLSVKVYVRAEEVK